MFFDSPKSSSMVLMLEVSYDTSQVDLHKFINWFWKPNVAELDMQATYDEDAHRSPCNKTLSMAKTLEIYGNLDSARESRFQIGRNVIISEPKELKKGKKVLDHEVVLEKSNGNRESLKITVKCFGLRGQT
jgi:hypothetical protein